MANAFPTNQTLTLYFFTTENDTIVENVNYSLLIQERNRLINDGEWVSEIQIQQHTNRLAV